MFRPGDVIGPYVLLRTLGRGAFGEVWLAERRSSLVSAQVALKLPFVEQDAIETVRKEAALWLNASGHPNVVPFLDADVYDGQVVIASEYIAGGSLHEWMQAKGGKAALFEEAVSMANGILAGLDYLHRTGLTHRDPKPENVLLQDGIPRLTDFGLARVLKTEGRTSSIAGTPRYMAPETFSGSYSAASDLWAVGVMLQELLSGSSPFPTGDLMVLIGAIQSHEPAPLPDTVPERLRAIVARLLAKDPAARYATASAVREALQAVLQPVSPAEEPGFALTPNNLPVQPTSFIGREREISELKSLLTTTRLLTLTGSGGCGKTRLALALAEQVMPELVDGVWLAELASLMDPALVPQTVAAVFGLKEEPGKPILQTLTEYLKGKSILLVLDNCEHLLDACARLADTILRQCPSVRILASSREGLGIAGELTYRVPSLTMPNPKHDTTPESLTHYEAVRLFIERAQFHQPQFTVTNQNATAMASVCYRLDGIPLAIELAAARVRSLSVEEVNSKLDQRFRLLTGGSRTALPRQQTLRSLIDWSYDLLNDSEKALLCRLSVFAGGWTLESAEQVCAGEPIEEWEVLDQLTSLSDKSLVVAEEQDGKTRYRLLETVRQYARDRLLESGEGETWRDRHLKWFLALAEEAAPQLGRELSWLDRLEQDHENLRAALAWAGGAGRDEAGLRLGAALSRFWFTRGYTAEGRTHLATLFALPGAQDCTALRASALGGAGHLAIAQLDHRAAKELFEESRRISQALGDKAGVAESLRGLGWVAEGEADYDAAQQCFEQMLALYRDLQNDFQIASALSGLGWIAFAQTDYPAARALLEEGLEIQRYLGDYYGISWSLNGLALLAHVEGDFRAARERFEESLRIFGRAGDKAGILDSLERLAAVSVATAEPRRAAQLFGAAEGLREVFQMPLSAAAQRDQQRDEQAARAMQAAEAFESAWQEGRAMTMEQAIELALSGAES